jgi:SAM-dependent methyltransferase
MSADASDLDPLRRFSDRVEDYVRYRPSYPPEAIRFMESTLGLGRAVNVADIGSGTGIFSRHLLDAGAKVFAVEPNDAMRAAAERGLRDHENFMSVKGTAEATGLGPVSVSLITCAQAFHWFDVGAARREFARILSPGGWCALIWNTTVVGKSDFGVGYERIKDEFDTDLRRVRHETLERAGRFDSLFGPGKWKKACFENVQTLDFDGLKGRLLSSSYAPKEGHPRFDAMISALRNLFDRCQKAGVVRMDYTTELFYGQLN